MGCFAKFAYVNRKNDECSIEGFLEPEFIPNCCSFEDDLCICRDFLDVDKEKPDVYTFTHIQGRNNMKAELVFCADSDVEEIYVESTNESEESALNIEPLKRCDGISEKSCFVFSRKVLMDIENHVGDLDVFIKTASHRIVVKVHVFWEDMNIYRGMISELSELSVSLIRNWEETWITREVSDEEQTENTAGEIAERSKWKRYIDTPADADAFLSELDRRISELQKHAETDLHQVYKKMPIRKAKHITPRTLIEYSCTQSPKVTALTTEEHYDIYEHRMILQYLQSLQELFVRRIDLCEHRIKEFKQKIDNIKIDEVRDSLSAAKAGYARQEDIEKKLNNTKEKYNKFIEKERQYQKEWKQQADRIDEITGNYAILHVAPRGEILHSSMLFSRNRYYRSVYEMIRSNPVVNVYKSITSMPAPKLCDLYERWCFFKMVSVIMETYQFEIYAFSTRRGPLVEENRKPDEMLRTVILNAISDTPYIVGDTHNYICIVLKKKGGEDYIKLEYQRMFGEPGSENRWEPLYPDYCITFGEKSGEDTFEIIGDIFFLDAKFKRYSKAKYIHEILYVAWYKYIYRINQLASDCKIRGSFILHPGFDNENGYWGYEHLGELYGADTSEYFDYYQDKVSEDMIIKWFEDQEDYVKIEEFFRDVSDPTFNRSLNSSGLPRRIGGFRFSPGNSLNLLKLLRMILEWEGTFGYENGKLKLVWNNCLICGAPIERDNIIVGETKGGFTKYHLTCAGCGEFWVKTHCDSRYCHKTLIKHTNYHNYLKQKQIWWVQCPFCGSG